MKYHKITIFIFVISLLVFGQSVSAEHKHSVKALHVSEQLNCVNDNIDCAKTVTSAFAPNGDLWRIWVLNSEMFFAISKNNGVSFAERQRVNIAAEKISARNENRPKIAFDQHHGVYLSWASPLEKKYTANIHFTYSSDYGKTFLAPITVNNDNLLAAHSFNEMLVSAAGDISLVWLDGRVAYHLRKAGKPSNGAALYLAEANFRQGNRLFTNQQIANNTCVCCRIALDKNKSGNLAILWRHIYADNIREFAMLTLNEQTQPIQVSYDEWQINGCPHQGGGLAIDKNNLYHSVWFNQGKQGKGIFYGRSSDLGVTQSTIKPVGDLLAQAAHAHIMTSDSELGTLVDSNVDIVWLQFNGNEHTLWHQRSTDSGKSFNIAKIIASAKNGADRPFIISSKNKNYVSWHRPNQGHVLLAL